MFHDSLGAALLRSARLHADRPALWALGERITYRELFERAAAIAAGLRALGLSAGERVCILSFRSATAYIGIIAALLAGCTYVPLNASYPKERNRRILTAADPAAIILDDRCASRVEALLGDIGSQLIVATPESTAARLPGGRRRLSAGDLVAVPLENAGTPEDISREDPVYILFTSGSTGVPKGVPISHANLSAYLAAFHPHVPLAADDRVLQAAELTFDQSIHDLFMPWLTGGEVYSAPENALVLAPRLIAQHALTECQLVPSVIARAVQNGILKPGGMPSLRYSLFGGESLAASDAEAWREAAPNSVIFNVWGPTETTVTASCFRIDRDRRLTMPVVPLGWPIGQQRMAAFDSSNREVAAGEIGEIYLSGPQNMRGYWRAPELDARAFVTIGGTRWYRTGDLGRVAEGCGIVFAGRADHQVKIRGYRVELQEIEGVLRQAAGRGQVAVIAWPPTADGAADGCVAFVVAPEVDESALRAACRNALPPYMVPQRIFSVADLPRNANGKTDYAALRRHELLTKSAPDPT